MALINRENFLKEWQTQEARAKEIIELLLIKAGFNNINYSISKEIIIVDATPKIKIIIKENPTIYIISDKNKDTADIDYKIVEVSNYLKQQSESK